MTVFPTPSHPSPIRNNNRNWSVFLEYKYANFGTNTANIVVPTVGLYTGSTKTNVQTISGGVNFRF